MDLRAIAISGSLWALWTVPASAAPRIELSGEVSDAGNGLYRITPESPEVPKALALAEQFRFSDPDGRLLDAFSGSRGFIPGPRRVVIELVDSGSSDIHQGILLSCESAWAMPRTASGVSDPALFAGTANLVHPSPLDPVSRELDFDLADLDSDGDGSSNLKDEFPNDPTETRDSDNDGLGNNADPDDDNDLMPDDFEDEFGLNPVVDDAADDLDRDRRTNFDEFVTGSAPNDGSSFFSADLRFETTPALRWRLRFPTKAGRTYRLRSGTTLSSPLPLTGSPVAVDADGTADIILPAGELRSFFQVEVQLTPP
ncbi:hypothetical protein [Luteolibacter marinus]|uniref:hypothetical protein n=1 Tax=Luteolibacter marinus TaxID=2776705 RepID=UPI0018673F23|nr:hypothetical protein [Luteolibacter marinus]